MKKEDVWNPEINPDGISDPIINLSLDVLDRGYFLETEDGTWYEIYVNEKIKKNYPVIDLNNKTQNEIFGKFNEIMFDHYEDDNQITFFVSHDEEKYNLDKLIDILIN